MSSSTPLLSLSLEKKNKENNRNQNEEINKKQQQQQQQQQRKQKHHVVVIVLGDLGRSPRMQYHVVSLLETGYKVTVIGYNGEQLIPKLHQHQHPHPHPHQNQPSDYVDVDDCDPSSSSSPSLLRVIRFTPITTLRFLERYRYLQPLYFVWRIITLSFHLLYILLFSICILSDRIDCILVQNPPAMPLLGIVYVSIQVRTIITSLLSLVQCIFVYLLSLLLLSSTSTSSASSSAAAAAAAVSTTTTNTIQVEHAAFIIDWHNLGYTMLRDGSTVQKIAKVYERYMAPKADGHFTVTKAMKQYIETHMLSSSSLSSLSSKVQLTKDDDDDDDEKKQIVSVLYDCPPELFQTISIQEQHELFIRLDPIFRNACPPSWYNNVCSNSDSINQQRTTGSTLFTEKIVYNDKNNNNENKNDTLNHNNENNQTVVQPRIGRPALVTSSTSWTPDEDFGLLLDALVLLDKQITSNNSNNNDNNNNDNNIKNNTKSKSTTPETDTVSSVPLNVVVVVTGKGPQKEMYLQKIQSLHMKHIIVCTMWLEPCDYPKLISCTDIGISLHTSTSQLDLPMKILDYYGCSVPVCAYYYKCLGTELVHNNSNGRTFTTSIELATQLYELLVPLVMTTTPTPTPSPIPPTEGVQPYGNHDYGLLKQYSETIRNQCIRWDVNWKQNALPLIEETIRIRSSIRCSSMHQPRATTPTTPATTKKDE